MKGRSWNNRSYRKKVGLENISELTPNAGKNLDVKLYFTTSLKTTETRNPCF